MGPLPRARSSGAQAGDQLFGHQPVVRWPILLHLRPTRTTTRISSVIDLRTVPHPSSVRICPSGRFPRSNQLGQLALLATCAWRPDWWHQSIQSDRSKGVRTKGEDRRKLIVGLLSTDARGATSRCCNPRGEQSHRSPGSIGHIKHHRAEQRRQVGQF
jgi:hypothetical protein